MSDDLISRKAVLEELESLRVALTGISCRKEYQTTQKEIMNSVIRIIEEQPTAFHKEKVIEELKKNMGSAELAQALAGSDLVQSGGFSYGYYNGVKESIEIVEKGGV